jgi:hypothetical protein
MVSHYLTIKLIGREHIPGRKTFHHHRMREVVISGINHRFRWLSRSQGQITHVLLTRSPLEYHRSGLSARLACVKHAASVRPEPGSNSPSKNINHPTKKARQRPSIRATSPDRTKLAKRPQKRASPESLSKKPRHQPKKTGANGA